MSRLEKMVVALVERDRHRQGICRWNHTVEFHHGWLYIDGYCVGHDPEIVMRAKSMIRDGFTTVPYCAYGTVKQNIE